MLHAFDKKREHSEKAVTIPVAASSSPLSPRNNTLATTFAEIPHVIPSVSTPDREDFFEHGAENLERWNVLGRGTFGLVIEAKYKGSEDTKLDEVTMLLAIAVYVLHAPPDVVSAPNLQYPCINQFRQCLQSNSVVVKLKCVQTLRTIFCHTDRNIATPYIHTLAPRLVEFLYTESSKHIASEGELLLTMESINTVESLVMLTEPQFRIQLLTLLVPILINRLLEGPLYKEANKFCRMLHDQCLQKLMKIGPQYPQEFKSLMTQSSDLRMKLEAAVRASQQAQQKVKVESHAKPISTQGPTIKLITDFSNFTS